MERPADGRHPVSADSQPSKRGVTEWETVPPVDIRNYPAVKAHLDQYWEKIEKRYDKGDTPYNLRNCAYMEEFAKEKIVWGNLALSSQFALSKANEFINAPSPLISPASLFLLAILNSKIGDHYIRSLGVTRNGGYFEYKPMFVEKLPVPQLPPEQQKPFEDLVEQILLKKEQNQNTTHLENQIDVMVYKLYQLDYAEIRVIDPAIDAVLASLNLTPERYAEMELADFMV